MLVPNKNNIEQIIYTACGKDATGAFGVWSASSNELKQSSNNQIIISAMSDVFDGIFDEKSISSQVLKDGAKPSGFFKKTYKETDYERVKKIIRDKIHTIKGIESGNLKGQLKYEDDFRGREQYAPYRIAYTKLGDGRLLLCRVSAIGRVYSNKDLRSGNRFYHGYIFPKGTEIEDIDLSKIDFKKGLEAKYWANPTHESAPELLEKLTLDELYENSAKTTKQGTTQTQQRQTPQRQTQQRPTQTQQNFARAASRTVPAQSRQA